MILGRDACEDHLNDAFDTPPENVGLGSLGNAVTKLKLSCTEVPRDSKEKKFVTVLSEVTSERSFP